MNWIKVEDDKPPKYKIVWLYEKSGRCISGYYGNMFEGLDFYATLNEALLDSYPTTNVTHWAYIIPPELPSDHLTESYQGER